MTKNIVLTLSLDEARRVLDALDAHQESIAGDWDLDDVDNQAGTPDWVFETLETLCHVGDVLEDVLTLSLDEARKVLDAIDAHQESIAGEWDLDDVDNQAGTPDWVFETLECLAHVGDVLEDALEKTTETV